MGKNTTNKFQKAYMLAKAHVDEIEYRQVEIEKKYIADKGIVNPDGSIPEFLFCMDDDAAFEIANEEVSALITAAGLEDELNAAHDELKLAEDSLIAYGLSIIPAGIREKLEKEMKENPSTREKVLDLTFRLDTSTVPK